MYIRRHLDIAFLEANQFFPVLLLTGARQVGKTTFLSKIAEPDRRFVSLDPLDVRAKAKDDPRLFLADNPPPVIIDEIQYVPELLPYIKANVDRMRRTDPDKAHGMYWLTGSQKFELMHGVSESLSGRIGIFNMHPLSNRELNDVQTEPFRPDRFAVGNTYPLSSAELFHRIWLGAYPGLVCSRTPDKHWTAFYQSYVQTYLERDIRKLAQVADLNVFYAFLKAAAARSGQMLNYSDLARDSEISVPTTKKYMSLLETSGIAKLLYPFSRNQSAPMVSTPKMYFLDTGLMAFLTDWTNPQVLQSGAAAGHFFETWCVAEILKSYANAGIEAPVYYFRTKERNPAEIDILIVDNGTLYPTEIKKSARLDKNDAKQFSKLETFKMPVGTGGLLSLYPEVTHVNEHVVTIPAQCI